jgi:F-type H+-transporting ATPase subunit delta
MQEKLTIARPYAVAAFRFAVEADDVAAWSSMLNTLGMAVSDPGLGRLIGHPRVSDEQLLGLITEVAGAELNDKRRNFVEILIDAERLAFAPEIAALFERRRAAAEGVVEIEISSAYALDDAEQQKISDTVRARLGKECELACEVDPELIGGAVIKIGDSVIDISLRGRLRALEQQLT